MVKLNSIHAKVRVQEVDGKLFSPSSLLKGSEVPTTVRDDVEEDEEDNGDSDEDDSVEQFDEDELEWGTDLELEEYSGDTVVNESIQFPRETADVDENTEEQLESVGDGQFSGETKLITTDHATQDCSSGEEDDFEVDEDHDSIVQTHSSRDI
ncbi:hypothetical protein L2E82_51626 [Cichorium intybus]|nr:hypothetical protein L2E82_51626 [Cichorium intybus]